MGNYKSEMMNNKNHRLKLPGSRKMLYSLIFIFSIVFPACSSAPKKPAEIFTNRNIAASQLNLANQAANRGRYENALNFLVEARRLALAADDPQLRIKTSLSRGNILFSMGRHDEALVELKSAAAEGDASGETVLAALVRIYIIRAQLRLQEDGTKSNSAVKELTDQLNREMVTVKDDALATAAGNITMGMAEKLSGRWAEAEGAITKALTFHEAGRYLEDAAYDWFLIASVRSVAGNYNSAIDALNQAIRFDRRAENSFGLASSWQALGDVYKKSGQIEKSREAHRRAAEIFRAVDFTDKAEKLEALL